MRSHQQLFHELAIPHLYTSIVTDSLAPLINHLDNATPSVSSKITSKRDRLLKTRHLRISSFGPVCQWTVEGLLKDGNQWCMVAETCMERSLRLEVEAEQEIRILQRSPEPFRHGQCAMIKMPLLERIVIGQVDVCGWSHVFDCPHPSTFARQAGLMRLAVTAFLLQLDPRIICSHADWSPYAPQYYRKVLDGRLQMVCTHHHLKFGSTRVAILPGRINRHYFKPKCTIYSESDNEVTLPSPGLRALLSGVYAISDTPGDSAALSSVNTKIELLGYTTPILAFSPNLADLEKVYGPWSEDHPFPGQERYYSAKREEESMARAIVRGFNGTVEEKWKDRLFVNPWDRVPPCEACGWTTDDAFHPTEGLATTA